MELLLEAGFHPLEVFRAATMHGAEALHEPKGQLPQFGIVRAGLLADMVLVDQNPLQNIKVLYGTGHLRLNNRTGQMERVGGIRYTIKDGIVYDAKKLLADVAVDGRGAEEAARAARLTGKSKTHIEATTSGSSLACEGVASADRQPEGCLYLRKDLLWLIEQPHLRIHVVPVALRGTREPVLADVADRRARRRG